MNFQLICEKISQIPDVMWAAIIASLLTLGGVWLTNRGSYKRLNKQLLHDATERDKERKMELRQQIYIEATEAVTASYMILTKLSNLDIPASELSMQFAASSATISKVSIIGSADTVKTVTELSSALGTKYLQLLAKRIPLMQRKESIDIRNKYIEKSLAERNRLIELMKEMNLRGSTDPYLWDGAKKSFEFEEEQFEKFSKERDALAEENSVGIIHLMKECLKASREVGEYIVPAISSVRREMDIPFDEEAYRLAMELSWQEGERSISEFIGTITKIEPNI